MYCFTWMVCMTLWIVISICLCQYQTKNVLIYPYSRGFTSRIVDFRHISVELIDRGYNVSILINTEDKHFLDMIQAATFYEYPTPSGVLRPTDEEYMRLAFTAVENSTQIDLIMTTVDTEMAYCRNLLDNQDILKSLKNLRFDLFIVDHITQCGRILTDYFDIPTIVYHTMGLTIDSSFFPNIPSYTPLTSLGFPSKMNFKTRFVNTIAMFLAKTVVDPYWFGSFDKLKAEYGMNISLKVINSFVSRLTMTVCDFALDEPRPVPPNIICVGGMHNKPGKPLDRQFQQIMNNAREDVILVSFGTLLPEMDKNKFDAIFKALENIDATIIWKYKGDLPDMVSEKIHITEWMPQNDLLSHPKVKVFVTHCGSHSTYETAYHGVPVVAVPIFADQFDMAVKLIDKANMGIKVDFQTLTHTSLKEAIDEVLYNDTYTKNAKKVSRIMADHPVSAKEKFYFYVDYMIRNEGASHLVMEPLLHLSNLQIFCIDVLITIMMIIIISINLFYCAISKVLNSIYNTLIPKKRDKLN